MKRMSLSRSTSRRNFSYGARGMHSRNNVNPMRGGIRL